MQYELTHVRLLVANFGECFRFYRDVLGFAPVFGTEDEVYADFNTGPVTVALFDQGAMSATVGTSALPARPAAQDAAALILRVADVDAAAATLRDRGVRLVTEPEDRPEWFLRTAHFRDPAGNLIEIYEELPHA